MPGVTQFIPEDEFILQFNLPNNTHTTDKIWRDMTKPGEVESCIIVAKSPEPFQKDQTYYAYLALNTKGIDPNAIQPPPSDVIFRASDLTTDANGVPGDTTSPLDKSVAQSAIAYLIAYQRDPVDVRGDVDLNVQVSGDFQKKNRKVTIAGVTHSLTDTVPSREALPKPAPIKSIRTTAAFSSFRNRRIL